MPPHPAFLSCVLRLQIRDRNLCCCGAISAGAFRPAGKCRGLFEVLAFGRLQIPAGDTKNRRRGHDNIRADRKHTAVVRTQARRIGSAIVVALRSRRQHDDEEEDDFAAAWSLLVYAVAMRLENGLLLQRLKPLFHENFEKLGELGAAVSLWQNGKQIIDLCGGFCDANREKPWTADTLVLVWSATKGIGSACVLHALQQQKIELNRHVAEFWPEFAQADKDKITLGQLLSHQAGLCALDQRVDVLDYNGVIRALEAQAPSWPPGTAHGYHARTFGFLLDELIRRIAGKTLSNYWQENLGEPLELDFWIGLPEEENSRVAR